MRITTDWSWDWRPYFGVWVLVALFVGFYALSWRRHLRVTARVMQPDDWRHVRRYGAAMVALVVASDWPLGALGAAYLLSAHMTQ
ncbi:MAG: hypothetical protein WKF45_02815, partial [Ilumatobacteraceae bacterium]